MIVVLPELSYTVRVGSVVLPSVVSARNHLIYTLPAADLGVFRVSVGLILFFRERTRWSEEGDGGVDLWR